MWGVCCVCVCTLPKMVSSCLVGGAVPSSVMAGLTEICRRAVGWPTLAADKRVLSRRTAVAAAVAVVEANGRTWARVAETSGRNIGRRLSNWRWKVAWHVNVGGLPYCQAAVTAAVFEYGILLCSGDALRWF